MRLVSLVRHPDHAVYMVILRPFFKDVRRMCRAFPEKWRTAPTRFDRFMYATIVIAVGGIALGWVLATP